MTPTSIKHAVTGTLSTLVSLGAVIAGLWAFAEPAIGQYITDRVEEKYGNQLLTIQQALTAIQQQQTSDDVAQNAVRQDLDGLANQIDRLVREQKDDELEALLRQLLARTEP